MNIMYDQQDLMILPQQNEPYLYSTQGNLVQLNLVSNQLPMQNHSILIREEQKNDIQPQQEDPVNQQQIMLVPNVIQEQSQIQNENVELNQENNEPNQNGQAQLLVILETDQRIQVFKSLIRQILFEMILHIGKVVVGTVAMILNNGCKNIKVVSFVLFGISIASMVLFQLFFLSLIKAICLQGYIFFYLLKDHNELIKKRELAQLQYSGADQMNAQRLFDAFQNRHKYFKTFRLLYFWQKGIISYYFRVYFVLFIYGNVVVIGQNSSSDCQIGQTDSDLMWAVTIIYLIFCYLGVGLPVVFLILYIIFIVPVMFFYGQQQQPPRRIQRNQAVNQVKYQQKIIGQEYIAKIKNINS